jgi:excisionase family DNA binding protein
MVIVGEPSAVIGGWECVVLGVALRGVQRRHGFARFPSEQRAIIDRTIADLEEAGRRWRAGVVTGGQARSNPAHLPELVHIGLCSASPELLTTGEVAETLGVSVSTVKRLVGFGAGRLPAVKVGGRSVRYRRSDVDELVRGRSNGD